MALVAVAFVAFCPFALWAEDTAAVLAKAVKASLVFEEEIDQAGPYPNQIRVFLRLENVHDSHVTWVTNQVLNVHAEVLDPNGEPVKESPRMSSIQSNPVVYRLPFRSRMDWDLSAGGIAMGGDRTNAYAVVIGTKGWLLPKEKLGEYSMRVRVNGWAFTDRVPERGSEPQKVLFEVPATKIRFGK